MFGGIPLLDDGVGGADGGVESLFKGAGMGQNMQGGTQVRVQSVPRVTQAMRMKRSPKGWRDETKCGHSVASTVGSECRGVA